MNPPPSNRGTNWHNRVYFGLHYDLHASMNDTELGASLTHEHLRAELAKVRPDFVQCDCKGHPGITSWPTEVGTPSKGIVNDALRIHRDVTRELGIPLAMHYSGVWDDRAIELHPDWAWVGPAGEVAGKEGFVTGATCNLSPYTKELMIPQLIELIDKYDVDGFWVDGENWATRACYCERCRSSFAAETGVIEPPAAPGEPRWGEWAAFHRRNFVAHVREYTDAVHAHKPDCTVCSNWMYTVGQPDAVDAPVDYLSGDFPWRWSLPSAMLEGRFMDSRRLTNPDLGWDLMAWAFTTGEPGMGGWTMKHAPALCQEAAAVISLGGAVMFYSNPQRSGHLNGWSQDLIGEAARFARARREWCENTVSVPQAAVLHNSPHFYAHTGDILMAAWANAQKPVAGALHALLEDHISTDVLNEDALAAHIGSYALVVIPEQSEISDHLFEIVSKYVRGGGRLVVSGETALRFGALAEISADGDPRGDFFPVSVGREVTTVKGPWQPIKFTGSDVSVTHNIIAGDDPAFNGAVMPAATRTEAGKGRIAAIPGPLFDHFADTHYPRTRALIGEIVAGLAPDFTVRMDAPARVHLVLRRQGDRLIAHLINTGSGHPLSPTSQLIEDVPRTGPVTLRIKRAERPGHVYLAPGMEGLAWDWKDAELTVYVDSVGIMDSVVVE